MTRPYAAHEQFAVLMTSVALLTIVVLSLIGLVASQKRLRHYVGRSMYQKHWVASTVV